MRPVMIASVVALSASVVVIAACTSVLGIDGTFESVPQAFCSDVASRCGGIPGFDQTKCEQSLPGSLTHDDYVGCIDAGDCNAFVACFSKAMAGACPTASPIVGRPCSGTPTTECCTKTCSVDAGAGVCQ